MIIKGDCIEEMEKLESNSVDLAFLDPPYKLSQAYSSSVDSDNILAVASIYPTALELKRIVKQGNFACVIYDNRILPLVLDAFRRAGWKYLRFLTLYRRCGNAFRMHGWMSTSDCILLFQNGEGKENYYGKCSHDVYVKEKLEKVGFNHPAQKPLDVCKNIIQRLTQEGDMVIDPYCGSGTIPVACKELNRNFIGIDNCEEYIETTNKRLTNASTVQKASEVEDGN
jgi:site-specific DNA-methyltransferase (adenine-specific)